MTPGWTIRPLAPDDAAAWVELRAALWPDQPRNLLEQDARDLFAPGARPRQTLALLAVDAAGVAIGFADATIRHDHVNGTDTSPVGFLEGWYVAPRWRRRGVGRALVEAVARWTRAQGCMELASDTWLDHVDSQRAHAACGFEESDRVVFFRKRLAH